jgi:hypothetical protein
MERKIIFKCQVGSHLYGTSRPESDLDFQGVFLPSLQDLLSLDNCPSEWTENIKLSSGPRNTAGDVDCKYFSLQKFLRLAAQGQPGQLEMLFAPSSVTLVATEEWQIIQDNKDILLSSKGIAPFIGFAIAQMHKASCKGENLNQINHLIEWGSTLTSQNLNGRLSELLRHEGEITVLGDVEVKYYMNDFGAYQVDIAGRNFDIGIRTKNFIDSLKKLESRYGSRSRAAAIQAYDYKSLGHAIRLLGEAEEFLQYGKITLPRPDAEYLKTVLRGTIEKDIDWSSYLESKIDYLRQVIEPRCTLPSIPNWSKINDLCIQLLSKHIGRLP